MRADYPAIQCGHHARIAVAHKYKRHQKSNATLPLGAHTNKEGLLEVIHVHFLRGNGISLCLLLHKRMFSQDNPSCLQMGS